MKEVSDPNYEVKLYKLAEYYMLHNFLFFDVFRNDYDDPKEHNEHLKKFLNKLIDKNARRYCLNYYRIDMNFSMPFDEPPFLYEYVKGLKDCNLIPFP